MKETTTKKTNQGEAEMNLPTTPFKNSLGHPVWPARAINEMTNEEVEAITGEVFARLVEAKDDAPTIYNENCVGPHARKKIAALAVAAKAVEAILARQS
jgi:hypothetical protein